MKRIYLEFTWKMHPAYKELVNYPPEGYEFIVDRGMTENLFQRLSQRSSAYRLMSQGYKMLPLPLVKSYLDGYFKKVPKQIDLTFSYGHLVFRKEPWVIDLGGVADPVGLYEKHLNRYRRTIERTLTSKWCKAVLCWTDFTRREFLSSLDCSGFKHKIIVISRAVHKKNFVKSYDDNIVTLFFIGSAAVAGEFKARGGQEVLEAFSLLRKKYDNLHLVIRSDIPKDVKRKYEKVLTDPRVTCIEKVTQWAELEEIYKACDIFLFPGHYNAWMVILEAMSYELPVVVTNEYANAEQVQNGKTGFVITGYQKSSIRNITSGSQGFSKLVETVDAMVVQELVEKTSLLVENTELRRRLGKAGRWEIEHGKFSIERRNEKLKRVFDEATGD
ncbi:MAG: glycosyltransferase family 4 protein [Dehalococcoidales bacterium]|nr:glycosyltransferase family 4 protein [Dehalococcoidales bacterium]